MSWGHRQYIREERYKVLQPLDGWCVLFAQDAVAPNYYLALCHIASIASVSRENDLRN